MKQLLLATFVLVSCNAFGADAPHGCKAGQSNYFVSYNFSAKIGAKKVDGFGNQIICATAEKIETADGIDEARKALERGLRLDGKEASNALIAILFFKQLKN